MNTSAITMSQSESCQLSQPTLADVLKAVQEDASLPTQKKRDLACAVRKVATWIGPDGLMHPANPGVLGEHIRKLSPAMTGLSREGMANVRSRLRSALKLAGISVHEGKQTNTLSPEWLAISERLGPGRDWRALSRFAHFASARGWKPSEIGEHSAIDRVRQQSRRLGHRQPTNLVYLVSRFVLATQVTHRPVGDPFRLCADLVLNSGQAAPHLHPRTGLFPHLASRSQQRLFTGIEFSLG